MNQDISIAYLEWLPHIKKLDTPRYLAILRSARAHQPRLAALTQLHSTLADIVETSSDPMVIAIALAWWREACEALTNDAQAKPHPLLLALSPMVKSGKLDANLLLNMIASREYELDSSLLNTASDFNSYIDGSIGALHLAWAQILMPAPIEDTHKDAIIMLSRGFAIMRLIFAIPALAQKQMLRFSESDMAEFGLAHSSESLSHPDENLEAFCQAMSEKALDFLNATAPFYKALPTPLRVLYKFAMSDMAMLKKAQYNAYDTSCHRPQPLRNVLIAMRA